MGVQAVVEGGIIIRVWWVVWGMDTEPFRGMRPFVDDNITIEFSDASPTGTEGEEAEVESRIQEELDRVSPMSMEPPRVGLEVKEVAIGNLKDKEAHVHLDQDFLPLEALDAIRGVVEDEYGTSGGQIK